MIKDKAYMARSICLNLNNNGPAKTKKKIETTEKQRGKETEHKSVANIWLEFH